jgi:hypothetical protein
MVACCHRVGNLPCNIIKNMNQKGGKNSEQSLMIKLGISSGPTNFDGLRLRISCSTSESEIEGSFKKSEKVKRALFGITTEGGELKIKEK